MKRFTKTRLFRLLKEGKENQLLSVWAEAYDDFARIVFAANTTATDNTEYHHALCYIRVELIGLREILKKMQTLYPV
jgi:hypothetical protein